MSIAVVIAAVIIYFKPTWTLADPICTYIFSLIVLLTVGDALKQCMEILMEGAPNDLETEQVLNSLKELPNVKDIHDFHLWQISTDKYSLSAHIVVKAMLREVLIAATTICKEKFGLDHCTFQIEEIQDQ